MSRFLGITREQVFSPGRVEDDSAILETVAHHLRQLGHTAQVIGGDDAQWPEPAGSTVVFAMCQGPQALERLHRWQTRGVRIINRPEGILNCQRHRTIAVCAKTATPFAESVLVETGVEPGLPSWVAHGGAWVKRGDVHATQADDVVFVDSVTTVRHAVRGFAARGVQRAVIQRHAPGTVLKFYAVRQRFFHCVPPANDVEIAADILRRIDELGQRAAQVLNVEVYGGDCVCGVNGALTLIDLNDWPSYAPCRAEAARQIAAYLLAQDVASDV